MKRIAQVLGVLGGLGAVAWAIRDRFVSVAISREPQPPAFRVVEPAPGTDVPDAPDERIAAAETLITGVSGIGPVYATRLGAAGINSLTDLAGSDVDAVTEAAQVPASRASDWIADAQRLSGGSKPA